MRNRPARWIVSSCLCVLSLAPAGCGPRVEPADLVFTNGVVATADESHPSAEAIAVRGGRVAAVGTSQEIQAYVGDATRVIDLAGRFAMPGLIESHAHFTGVGEAKMQLELMGARTWDEIVAMVAEKAKTAKPGEWITGRGWHQEKWDRPFSPAVEGFPTEAQLSAAAPDNPVLLTHASGHATIVNRKAMELAGLTRKTPNPAGGEILKDAKGEPTGVLRETASGLVRRAHSRALAERTTEEKERDADREIELAAEEFLSKGITSVHDAGASFGDVDRYKRFADAGKLRVRLYVMLSESNDRLKAEGAKYRMVDAADGHLTVRAIKRLADGALGSRGAWLLEPYADLPTSTGLNTYPMDQLAQTAAFAAEHGFQLCVHAIGDRANRETLDVYEAAFRSHPDKKDLRWRVEHAQHIAAADIPRFGALGVLPSMQGIHCTSDAPYVLARLGPARAAEGAYVWQKLMKSGAVIPNGTDAPVEAVDPMPGYHALVARRQKNGEVFHGDQVMSREEALRAYTLNGAYAAFEEKTKGSLTPGKYADITVLSTDITKAPEAEIEKAQVLYTVVGGKIEYERKQP
jgi:predicted amidohydrolase YtcJ